MFPAPIEYLVGMGINVLLTLLKTDAREKFKTALLKLGRAIDGSFPGELCPQPPAPGQVVVEAPAPVAAPVVKLEEKIVELPNPPRRVDFKDGPEGDAAYKEAKDSYIKQIQHT